MRRRILHRLYRIQRRNLLPEGWGKRPEEMQLNPGQRPLHVFPDGICLMICTLTTWSAGTNMHENEVDWFIPPVLGALMGIPFALPVVYAPFLFPWTPKYGVYKEAYRFFAAFGSFSCTATYWVWKLVQGLTG